MFLFICITEQEELCHKREVETCEEEGSAFVGPILLMFLAQFFVGIAISIFFSVGVTYLDDNISKKTYPIYYSKLMVYMIICQRYSVFTPCFPLPKVAL